MKKQKYFFYDESDGFVAFMTMDDILANGTPDNGVEYIGPVIYEANSRALVVKDDILYVINTFSGNVMTVNIGKP